MRRQVHILLFSLSLTVLFGCSKDPAHQPDKLEAALSVSVPEGFPAIQYPADNAYTPERAELGRMLFYEPLLSRDSSVSCGSCHKLEHALADYQKVSPGVAGRIGSRNSPGLANLAYHPYFMREGGVPTLEMQVLVPIQEHSEMDFNIVEAGDRLRQDPNYNERSVQVYGREMDYYVITRALANFERTILSGNSRYDSYKKGGSGVSLSDAEKAGMDLFFSERTGCANCHGGFLFTEHAFQNNGTSAAYPDPGRFRLTGDSSDIGRFKVPSLRNCELTAPYMHDGSIPDLEAVVEHYNKGGSGHFNQDGAIRALNLSRQEKEQIVAFLKSLTDLEFINNEKFKE